MINRIASKLKTFALGKTLLRGLTDKLQTRIKYLQTTHTTRDLSLENKEFSKLNSEYDGAQVWFQYHF